MGKFTIEDFQSEPISPENRFFKGMFYGSPGSGKTTLAASIGQLMMKKPNPMSTVIVAADPGFQSLVNFPELLSNTAVVRYQGGEWINTYVKLIQAGKFPEIETLVFDTYSHMTDDIIDYLMDNVEEWTTNGKDTNNRVVTNDPDIVLPGQSDYHYARNAMRVWVNRVMKLPMNVILLAHDKESGPLDRDEFIKPNGTDGVNTVINRVVQVMGYTEVVEKTGADPVFKINFKKSRKLNVKSWLPDMQGRSFTHEEFLSKLETWKEM